MSWPRVLRAPAAKLVTLLARPASLLIPRLRWTDRVQPLSDSFYSVAVSGADGTRVDLSRFDGQVTLVVNVASQCGFTPQYAELQALQERYTSRGFTVLGFPSNEFGGQEPGSDDDVRRFCRNEYGVTFPVFAKTRTQPGEGQSPAWRRLAECGHLPTWNFYKFLVGRNGHVAAVFPMTVPPGSRVVRRVIERELLKEWPSPAGGPS